MQRSGLFIDSGLADADLGVRRAALTVIGCICGWLEEAAVTRYSALLPALICPDKSEPVLRWTRFSRFQEALSKNTFNCLCGHITAFRIPRLSRPKLSSLAQSALLFMPALWHTLKLPSGLEHRSYNCLMKAKKSNCVVPPWMPLAPSRR